MENNSFDISKVKIDRIDIVNAKLENNSEFLSLHGRHFNHSLHYSITPGINASVNRVRILFDLEIETFNQEKQKIDINANYSFSFIFLIEGLGDAVEDKEEPIVDMELFVTLASIAYSTSRGIVFTKFQGSIMEKVILPILPDYEIENLIFKSAKDQLK